MTESYLSRLIYLHGSFPADIITFINKSYHHHTISLKCTVNIPNATPYLNFGKIVSSTSLGQNNPTTSFVF